MKFLPIDMSGSMPLLRKDPVNLKDDEGPTDDVKALEAVAKLIRDQPLPSSNFIFVITDGETPEDH